MDGLVVHLIRLDGLLGLPLGGLGLLLGHLRLVDAGGQLALLGLHLIVFGVQVGLLGLEAGFFIGKLLIVVLQVQLGGLEGIQHLGLLDRDVLHHFVEGQQLVQVGHGGQHGHAASFPQFLHGAHKGLEIVPLVVDVDLLLVDLSLLGGDLLLLLADGVLHLGDLPFQDRDLPLDDGDLFPQVLFQGRGSALPLFGVGQLLPVLRHAGLDLFQLLLQVRNAGGRSRFGHGAGRDHQAERCRQQAGRPPHPLCQAGMFRVFRRLHR